MSLRLRVLPRFPARISGINGLSTYRDGPDLVIKSDYGSLIRIPAVDNEATSFVKVWNQDDDSYSIMTFEDLIAAIGVISGFMATATYDPTNKNQDVFAYAVAQATAAAATRLALAGGVMTGAIQDLVVAPSSAPTKKAAFDLSLITAGQQRSIKVPDADVALSKWELIGDYTLSAVSLFDIINLAGFRKLRFSGNLTLTAATTAFMRVSLDNGATFDAGATQYQYARILQSATTVTGDSGAISAMGLTGNTNVGAGTLMSFEGILENFNVAGVTLTGQVGSNAVFSSNVSHVENSLIHLAAVSARNALRFAVGSGTMTGKITLEGIRG